MKQQTENLEGWINFRKSSGEPIFGKEFKIPASKAVGKHAKRNILYAAGAGPSVASIRCVRHFMSFPIFWAQVVPTEHLIFKWEDISGVECWIDLAPDLSPAKFSLEREEDSQLALDELRNKHLDTLRLDFYPSPGRIIEAAGQVTELHHLELNMKNHQE